MSWAQTNYSFLFLTSHVQSKITFVLACATFTALSISQISFPEVNISSALPVFLDADDEFSRACQSLVGDTISRA